MCSFSVTSSLLCLKEHRKLLEFISCAKWSRVFVEAPAGVWCVIVSSNVWFNWAWSKPAKIKTTFSQIPWKMPSSQKKLAIQFMNALLGKNSPTPKNSKIHCRKKDKKYWKNINQLRAALLQALLMFYRISAFTEAPGTMIVTKWWSMTDAGRTNCNSDVDVIEFLSLSLT